MSVSGERRHAQPLRDMQEAAVQGTSGKGGGKIPLSIIAVEEEMQMQHNP